ncbi:glycosyltransferase family 8 protein [Daejeonella sp.]|uniref:glycosyltransferase family 8 protein n=1 Tax=Daejeonella sp. TaxID=2805397 RepID=UPI00272F7BDB|nr:glycosyltransferase family 8 protein [Daejeonella sp.]MDP2412393.1 glycosyltransferase family 8 protein [Daejeonella sp.]
MNEQNRITIISVCDNHYMIMLAALLKSIEKNHHSSEKIDYYIVEDEISSKNKQMLLDSTNKEIINIKWLKMSEITPKEFKLPLDYSSFPLNIYIRLFIPHFIPDQIEKAIYLDVDMIVLEDISKLWERNIGNKVIAGVVDRSGSVSNEWLGIKNYKDLGISPDAKYYNSGLLLINTQKWRQLNITQKVIKCIHDNITFADFPDQYGLNVVFANQWFELDPRWNSQAMLAIEKPFIIHFTGRKPFYKSYNYNSSYKDQFYEYLKQTKWNNFKPIGEYRRLLKKIYNKFEKRNWLNKSITI